MPNTQAVLISDLDGDVSIAKQVLAYARTLAPCIDSLERNSPQWDDVVAILIGARRTLESRPTGAVRKQTAGAWSKEWFSRDELGSAFGVDDLRVLRSLCEEGIAARGPIGSFPPPRDLGRLFP